MASPQAPVSAVLSEFASRVALRRLPRNVAALTKSCVLDQLGVQLGLSGIPSAQTVYEYTKGLHCDGPCTVIGRPHRCAPEQAAFINGVCGHAFEMDDYLLPSFSHPGTVVVPAALAVGEAIGASGPDVMQAVAAGYEVMGRIGRGVAPSHLYDRGFHPQSTIGVFGAAVAAGRLLGLNAEQMRHAIGLAVGHAGGTVEYSQTGGETQRLHAGIAAAGGVRSAFLAKAGYTGPREPLEGRFGFCRAYADRYDLGLMTAGLGETWICLYNAFKIRPFHGMVHTAVDVTVQAAGGRRIAADQVERITIAAASHARRFLGVIGLGAASTVEAQFSLHLPVAQALLGGGTFDSMLHFDPRDPDVRRVAEKLDIVVDEECEREYHNEGLRGPKFLNKVTIRLRDGTELTATNYAKGTPENPLTGAELRDKFDRLASRRLPRRRTDEIAALVMRCEELTDIRDLTRLAAFDEG